MTQYGSTSFCYLKYLALNLGCHICIDSFVFSALYYSEPRSVINRPWDLLCRAARDAPVVCIRLAPSSVIMLSDLKTAWQGAIKDRKSNSLISLFFFQIGFKNGSLNVTWICVLQQLLMLLCFEIYWCFNSKGSQPAFWFSNLNELASKCEWGRSMRCLFLLLYSIIKLMFAAMYVVRWKMKTWDEHSHPILDNTAFTIL